MAFLTTWPEATTLTLKNEEYTPIMDQDMYLWSLVENDWEVDWTALSICSFRLALGWSVLLVMLSSFFFLSSLILSSGHKTRKISSSRSPIHPHVSPNLLTVQNFMDQSDKALKMSIKPNHDQWLSWCILDHHTLVNEAEHDYIMKTTVNEFR